MWQYLGTEMQMSLSLDKIKDDDKDISKEGQAGLTALSNNIIELKDDNCLIFVPVLKEIDDAASQCFGAYEGTLGACQMDYEEALERYCGNVVLILKNHFSSEMHCSAEEKQMHKDVKACTYAWLLDTHQDNLLMPLMTGYMMDRVWKKFNAAKDGYTELVRMSIEDNENICMLWMITWRQSSVRSNRSEVWKSNVLLKQ
ncbi:hypothetical protein EDD22DRAFT_845586 [Suillus occidentalis]|nr:hypothetical protein EDD22DRAFT_845586 [Suillus occidentalis]